MFPKPGKFHLNHYFQDKTFGLKNKKGAKQQKFIAQVEKQVKSGGIHPNKEVDPKKLEKEKKLKEQRELAQLFKPVQTQKIEKGKKEILKDLLIIVLIKNQSRC